MRFVHFATGLCFGSLVACGGAPFVADFDGGAHDAASAANDAASADGATTADGAVADGAPGSSTGSLSCGGSACAIPANACCIYPNAMSVCARSCPNDPNAGGNAVALGCTGAASCNANEVCCIASANGNITSACKLSCVGNDAQLCDPTATPTGCAGGQACATSAIADWKLPPTFGTCGGKGN